MTVTQTFKAAAYQQQTDEVPLVILTIDHDDLGSPIRYVNNNEDIVSNGDTYSKAGFDIKTPKRSPDELPRATISVCNVDREVIIAIRSISTKPDITISKILASDPDTVEEGPYEFKLSGVEYDAFVVSGNLTFDDIFDEPYPGDIFTPANAPGLFQ